MTTLNKHLKTTWRGMVHYHYQFIDPLTTNRASHFPTTHILLPCAFWWSMAFSLPCYFVIHTLCIGNEQHQRRGSRHRNVGQAVQKDDTALILERSHKWWFAYLGWGNIRHIRLGVFQVEYIDGHSRASYSHDADISWVKLHAKCVRNPSWSIMYHLIKLLRDCQSYSGQF